jgi:cytochrome oxidase Cu insertion factor (SCO1/SenC/PrrC family)
MASHLTPVIGQTRTVWSKYPWPALTVWFALGAFSAVWAQDRGATPTGDPPRAGSGQFERKAPRPGTPLPDVTLYDAEGRPVRLTDLGGQYTVLIFGCLT